MKLWYGSDEVKEFHPVVEMCLNEALRISKLNEKYEIKHHYGSFTSGIPDFVLLDKVTKDFVCIIEVKKTPSDVFYTGYGYQAKGYVDELYPLRWKTNYFPHFCVTNIEMTQFFCWREKASLIGCILTNSPVDSGQLEEGEGCFRNFTKLFVNYFKQIDSQESPEFSMHLEAISESFNETFFSVAKILGVNLVRMNRLIQSEEEIKESIIYELLRFAFYFYIKENYSMINSKLLNYFPDFEVKNLNSLQLVNLIENNFNEAMKIDFKDILSDFKSPNALVPEKLKQDKKLSEVFNAFIQTLRDNAPRGIQKNQNLLNFVSLLTSEIFDKREMHEKGKIMSDEALSDVLAEFAITHKDNLIIDPCCGDGNLLISSYKKLRDLSKKSHNEILSQLTGIDIDANLIQLAAFKLICNNFNEINKRTLTQLLNVDLFNQEETNKYDSVVMNPPFLRNEDVKPEIKKKYLNNLEKLSKHSSFIRNAAQPNIYFYFIEKAISLLKNKGRASIILMTKFLNNKDGFHLKKFLIPHINAIISYPPDFFKGFVVTTCIIILDKNTKEEKISFLRVKDNMILSDVTNVKEIISKKIDISADKYSIINVNRADLNPKSNWKHYLIDPDKKFLRFEQLGILKDLDDYFDEIKRGKADNCGGSSIIFPDSSNNPIKAKVDLIESDFICHGLQRNKLSVGRRKIILTKECLNEQKGLKIPITIKNESLQDFFKKIKKYSGIYDYLNSANQLKIKGKRINLKTILESCAGSVHVPNIVIPRADRTKHIIYYNPHKDPVLISTNFFFANLPKNLRKDVDQETQIKFITAFLNSSFGQLQCEMHANNQEGLRKMEGFMIQKLKVLNLDNFSVDEIKTVVKELENLDSGNVDFSGTEKESSRDRLDKEIGKLIYKNDKMGFGNEMELTRFFKDFCREITMDRLNTYE